ncbi:MAG: hypothetical protein COV10_02975 [Candidatus Vogelbacteria bacterium CG10_big_fil_rev_8_21_14_0_10_51_16]|uniref:Uncharacterized protein n=1 Tax=Candidatus Vogelbacteria bacterium CG10_big_fil_rev_8_21_14_0_10_51_16 TaxID=1975045 RepID=A0A2H0RE34_9BACT|nr:MAG: hypothetical protein COV10_02975 [Candidatus Vogelbacteria bacterium CG10_big_fil_rev_8_21_14_0_10_51_16]
MYELKRTASIAAITPIIVALFLASSWGNDQLRAWGQCSEFAETVVRSLDLMDFIHSSGGPVTFGYENYYRWAYAKSLQGEDRPVWHRLTFWKKGFLCDFGSLVPPPDKYPYPRLWRKGVK